MFKWKIIDASLQQPRGESLDFDRLKSHEQALKEAEEHYESIKDTIVGHATIEIIGVIARYDADTKHRIY